MATSAIARSAQPVVRKQNLVLVKSADCEYLEGISEPALANSLRNKYVEVHNKKAEMVKVKGVFEGRRYMTIYAQYKIATYCDGRKCYSHKFSPQNTLQFPEELWSSGTLCNEYDFDESCFLTRDEAFRDCARENEKLFNEGTPVEMWGFVVEIGNQLDRRTLASAKLDVGARFGSLEWGIQMPINVIHPTREEMESIGCVLKTKQCSRGHRKI